MTALAAPRTNLSNKGPIINTLGHPAKATQLFYNGALVALNAGYLVPAAATAGLRVCGIVDLGNLISKDTTGETDGDSVLNVKTGIFPFAIGATTDALTQADALRDVYVLDDQTVGKLPGAGRPIAGQLIRVSGSLAYVAIGFRLPSPENALGGGTAWLGVGSVDAIAAPGAISVTAHITEASVDGTDAYTLADGLFIGQPKVVVCVAGANTPVGTITPATPNGFATVTVIGAVGDIAGFTWTADGWSLTSAFGVTFT